MSAPAPPIVPPRPVRAQQAAELGASYLPEIPPRPKRLDRSVSPGHYPYSPLNEPWAGGNVGLSPNDPSSFNQIAQPPRVHSLPSVGQEGSEYADIQYAQDAPVAALATDTAEHTRNVAEDLHLHAPKPSLPKSSATAQVQGVTKTDSHSGVHGVGKPCTPGQEDLDPLQRLKSKTSFSRPGSQASLERRRSIVYGDEQGPAELGMRVPINPLLGDVQAPSPAALTPTHTGHNGEKRRHSRTKSGREIFLPPGSYGLHGHGLPSQDKFEKDWYAKHPEQLQHEEGHGHGVYESIGSGRGNYAMSSDDLNKIVRDTPNRIAGSSVSGAAMSYPDEQIGYMASEQFVSRSQMASPNYLAKVHSNLSQPATESPLRKASFPADDESPQEFRKSKDAISRKKSEDVIESENEDAVHVDDPKHRYNKVTGGEESMHETEDRVPSVGYPSSEGGLADEHGYTAPILASDEVAKETGSDFMLPAVSPRLDRRGSQYEYEHRSSGDVTPSSRPASRPGSIYGMHSLNHSLSRFVSHHDENRENVHTPLEDVDEYEPLFPDEDSRKKASSTADRFKLRPDTLKHRFPSQDIWEDTPSSAMYEATVSTPDLPSQTERKDLGAASTFEHPDVEAARKGEPSEDEKTKLIPADERLAKSRFAPHLRDDMPTRPGMQPRFPSQDIWEDNPDSQYLVTTVQSPPMEDEPETSPVEAPVKPMIPPRPAAKSKLASEISPPTPPSVPARPQKRIIFPQPENKLADVVIPPNQPSSKEPSPTEIRKVPSIPDRPKPQIPPRPAKQTSIEGLTKTVSLTSIGSTGSVETEKASAPPPTKPKPQVPVRPAASGKFAALKGNFLNDLNQKLGVGPPKEKEPEPEVEQDAKPLGDARKGRARGPQRRAPAKSPSTSASADSEQKPAQFSMFTPKPLWHISSDDGELNVLSHEEPEVKDEQPETTIEPQATLAEEKVAQMEHSSIAKSPSAPTIDTTESRPEVEAPSELEDAPPSMVSSDPAANATEDSVDPAMAMPLQEKPGFLERFAQESGAGVSLSQHTTASSGAISGHTLERAETDPSTDAIPMSQHTTADSTISGGTLEKMETKEPVGEAEAN